jgi:putative FmdB family regulatory protein
MPLYEFSCRSCAEQFEALIRSNEVGVSCPQCGSTDVERLLSMFAVSSEATRQANLARARQANAKQAEEKRRADRDEEKHHHH